MTGMTGPDLGLDSFPFGASGSTAADAAQTQGAGAASQAAAGGVAPTSGQGTGADTGVSGEAGAMPSEQARVVPAEDLDKLRSTYDRQMAELRNQLGTHQSQNQQLAQAFWELQLQGLSPEQRQQAETARAFESGLGNLLQQAAAQQGQMQSLEPVFKKMAVDELTQQYGYAGVKREFLDQFDDPEVMEKVCSLFVGLHKSAAAQRQQPANAAAAGTSGSPAAKNWATMDMTELASLAFG